MTAAVLQLSPELDSVPAPKTKARSKAKTKAVAAPKTNWIPSLAKLRHALTIGMGCMIPLWCSLLSHVSGTMLTEESTAAVCLGIGIMVICCTLLALSLSHLASAVADITKSDRGKAGPWQSPLTARLSVASSPTPSGTDAYWYGPSSSRLPLLPWF